MEVLNQSKKILKEYFKKKYILLFGGIYLITTLGSIIFPYVFGNTVNLFISNQLNDSMIYIITLLLLQILLLIINGFYKYFKDKYMFGVDFRVKLNFLGLLQSKNINFSLSKNPGEIQYRMFSDITIIVNSLFGYLVEIPGYIFLSICVVFFI
ncbi:ABC transporter transmembrane domain-containing protein, partial [Paenibacillus sp. FSL R7-0179]|uniref:ABC transporter transmembrane domain-containing protein n=1 Tax=Paenibacillus sp. FSL R7-0179 TaxID=2921672 RepID=UPI0030F99D4A